MIWTSGNDIARAGGERNIRFTVRTMTQGQSVYPDIALRISNYCVYCIEDQNLTHNINAHNISKESRNLIGTAILEINKTLQTNADIDWSKTGFDWCYRSIHSFLDWSIPASQSV